MTLLLLGFVAWSGTGKTTLLERLIPRLVARSAPRGAQAHPSRLRHRPTRQDSHRLRQAGAVQVMAA